MSGLSKTAIALIVVVFVTLAALLAQLCYVLWCRRRFYRQNLSGEIVDLSGEDSYSASPSKELLYFFCWKNQSRIEPARATAPFESNSVPNLSPEPAGDLMKWRGLYGPSRVLFTIKEEEREDLEYSDKHSSETKKTKTRVSLEDHFEAVHEPESISMADTTILTFDLEKETPFSTPCDSPPYYTPSPSPTHEALVQRSDFGNLTFSPESDTTTVSMQAGVLQRGDRSGDGVPAVRVSLEV